MEFVTNEFLLTKRRKKTRKTIIQENRKLAVIQTIKIHEEEIKLKENWRERIQQSLEETKKLIEEKRIADAEAKRKAIEEALKREEERKAKIAAEKARIKSLEDFEKKAALNEARRQLREKILKGKELEAKKLQVLAESNKKQLEKQKQKRLEFRKQQEEKEIARQKEIKQKEQQEEQERQIQIRKERQSLLRLKFLKKLNEYNIDFTEDRRAIKSKILSLQQASRDRREAAKLRIAELKRLKIEIEQRRKLEEEEIRRRAEQQSIELDEYLAAAEHEFQTNMNNQILQEEINDAIDKERQRRAANEERIQLENAKNEKYKALQKALEETQRKAVQEYIKQIEDKRASVEQRRKLKEEESRKSEEERRLDKETWRAQLRETLERLKKEHAENPDRITSKITEYPSSSFSSITVSSLMAEEVEKWVVESFNDFYELDK